ncbi:MAG: HAMP domain-containing protein, partial [Myxococcales bacterium]|nr:HAMP domain-containing protein [Myxococcales bacterium]
MKLALKLALVQSVAIAVVFALHTAWSVDRAQTRITSAWTAAWVARVPETASGHAPAPPPPDPVVLEDIVEDRVLAALLVMLVAFVVVVGLSVRVVGRPLARFLAHTRHVGDGDLEARVPVGGRDEVGALALGMNLMTEQLATARARYAAEHAKRVATTAQLRHAERLKILGELAAATAHEMGTPLNVIRGRARLIGKDPATSEASAASAEVIVAQTDKLTARIRGVLGFARRRSHVQDAVDLGEVVTSSIDLLSPLLGTLQVDVVVTVDGGPAVVRGDASQLEQVMANLLMNAAQAMPEGGEV